MEVNSVYLISLFALLIVLIPNGVWVKSAFDIRTWMVFASVLLLPSFINLAWRKRIKIEYADYVLLAIIVLIPVSESFKATFTQALGSFVKAVLAILLPYVAGKYLIKGEKDLVTFFCYVSVAAILLSLIAYWEYNFKLSFYQELGLFPGEEDEWMTGQMLYTRFDQFRVTASFSHPLFFGTFLDLVVLVNILILSIYRSLANRFVTILLLVSITLAGTATLLTQSRTSIVALGIVLFFFLMRNRKRKRLLFFLIIISSLIYFLLTAYFGDYLGDFITRGFSLSSEESTGNFAFRLEVMLQSIVYVFSYMNFFGEGVLNNVQLYQFVYSTDLLNGFLYAFLTKGIFIGMLTLVLWFKAIRTTYVFRNIYDHARMFLYIMMYFLIVNNITMLYGQNETIFYIILGAIFNPYLMARQRIFQSPPSLPTAVKAA